MLYYINYNDITIGPMTEDQLFSYPVTPQTPICTEANQQWAPLFTHPLLMERLSRKAPSQNPLELNTTGKDKIVAGVLAILLGGLGAQYFYIGKISGGIICILLSAISCGLWGVITLIQGILMLTMTQAEFERKYVLSTSTFPVF